MRIPWGLGGLVTVILSIMAWLPVEVILRSIVLDDTFYYAKIAWHVAYSGKFSFDGVNPTNGFHPLWLALIVPLAAIFPEPESLLRAMLLLQALLAGLGAGLLWDFLARFSRSRIDTAISWGAILLLYYANWILFSGMEGALVFLMLILSLRLYEDFTAAPTWHKAFYMGLVWGGLFLARIDSAFLLAGVGVAWVFLPQSKQYRKGIILASSIAASLLLLYLMLNWHFFGHPLPVNALIKTSGQSPLANLSRFAAAIGNLFRVGEIGGYILLGSVAGALVVGALRYKHQLNSLTEGHLLSALDGVILCSALLHGMTVAFMTGSIYPWYLFLESLAIGWLFLRATQIWTKARWMLRIGFVSMMFWVWFPILRMRWTPAHRELHPALYEMALWIKAHLPPDAVIGSFDAGIIGYFSERQVVNLDGLVNSIDFVPYAVGDSVYVYLKKRQIGYLAQFFREDIYQDGRLSGSEAAWRALLCDTLYMRRFQYRRTGIFSPQKEAQGYALVLRLRKNGICPDKKAG